MDKKHFHHYFEPEYFGYTRVSALKKENKENNNEKIHSFVDSVRHKFTWARSEELTA